VGSHDEYGKQLLHRATDGAAQHYGPSVEVDYGAGLPARIDGAVGDIAIEVESRTSKQVRGAVLDLICHPGPKKLLLLLPVHMQNPEVTARQCKNALSRFIPKTDFRVVLLSGTGDVPALEKDTFVVQSALRDLGFSPRA